MKGNAKYLIVQERESQQWVCVGLMPWQTEEYYPNWCGGRRKKRQVQKTYVFPKPEDVSPFIRAHKVVEASSPEEAVCRISN